MPLVMTSTRSPGVPDLPTMIEAGVLDFEAVVWRDLSAPARTPLTIVDRLNASVRRALQAPEVIADFKNFGVERVGGASEEFDALIPRQLHAWADVVNCPSQGR
jgi:tripartite-type tricarboxylate transporter receptor subunit TctC